MCKKKNCLIMAMSTLPQSLKKELENKDSQEVALWEKAAKQSSYTYINNKGKITVEGLGQLEPIPKLLMHQINQEAPEEKLDKIIILGTEQTAKKSGDFSANKFFKHRIEQWSNANFKYSPDILPFSIDQKEKSEEEAITEIIMEMRSMGRECKFWIDTHGGLRGTQLIMDALIYLLKTEKITVEQAFSIEFNPGEKSKIIDVTRNLQIFDFVSGMNEFINYGRARGLEEYFKNRKKNDDARQLIEAISAVSETIQLCDMNQFREKLFNLAKQIEQYKKTESTDAFLDVFLNRIEDDYGVLISGNREEGGEVPCIEMIKWCLKKEFYQQALTLIESIMPEEIFKNQIAYCDLEEQFPVYNIIENKEVLTGGKKNITQVCKRHRVSPDYFCVNTLIILFKNNKLKTESNEEFISWTLKKINVENNKYIDITVKSKVLAGDREMIEGFLCLYNELKIYRNKANHANREKREDLASVREKMKKYISSYEEIYNYDEWDLKNSATTLC